MHSMACRIRRCRCIAALTQSQLAEQVGVKRSAVAQWESEEGTHPNIEHLTHIAMVTGVGFEWLATGRGPVRPTALDEVPVLMISDCAQDEVESQVLALIRKLPSKKQEVACKLLAALIA